MPLMKDVLSPETIAMLNAVAPDVEVEVPMPYFATAAEYEAWVNQLNHAACDSLTDVHVGDPFDLNAAWEAYNGCPLAVMTTVINQMTQPVAPCIEHHPTTYTSSLCDATVSDPSIVEVLATLPPRWLSVYAYWQGAADVWRRADREVDATRCSVVATMAAFESQFCNLPLLTYQGAMQ